MLTKIATKNKFKEFFSNKTVLACIILTFFYLLSGFWRWFEIGVCSVAIIFFIFLPVKESLPIYMYSHCFILSNNDYESYLAITTIGITLIFIVKYIIGIRQRKYTIYKTILVIIIALMLTSILVGIPDGTFKRGWMYITYLPLFYLFFAMRKEFDIHQTMNFMMVGIILSSSLSLIFQFMPGFKFDIFFQDNSEKRFMAFTNHPNSLYIRALFCLTYYMYMLVQNKIKPFMFIPIYCITAVIILSTLSKLGITLLAFFTIITAVLFLLKDFKSRIKYVLMFGILVLIIGLICHEYITEIFKRFIYDKSFNIDIINTITTGRDDIWAAYIKACTKTPVKLLFGNGLLTPEVYIPAQGKRRACHSLYIFILYRFGLIGMIAIGALIYLMIKSVNRKTPKLSACLPLIMFLIVGISANVFKSYNFTYIILSAQILYSGSKAKVKKAKTNDTSNMIEEDTQKNNEIKNND